MPIHGVTNVETNTKNLDYSASQQSYGFWAVSSDPGVKGSCNICRRPTQSWAYWIGCIPR